MHPCRLIGGTVPMQRPTQARQLPCYRAQGGGLGQAFGQFALALTSERTVCHPEVRLGAEIQQPAEFGVALFTQRPFTTAAARVSYPHIQPDISDKGVRMAKGFGVQTGCYGGGGDGTNARNGIQSCRGGEGGGVSAVMAAIRLSRAVRCVSRACSAGRRASAA